MKFGKAFAVGLALVIVGIAARADLAHWVQHQPAGPVLDALIRTMSLPGGAVRFRLPPAETRLALTKLIGADPKNAALYRLRAQEAEMQLDFTAAGSDWKAYSDLAPDRGEGHLELADFYHRRVRAAEEIAALEVVGGLPSDPYLPPAEQRAWQAFERMIPVIRDAGLPATASAAAFRNWIARYPGEQAPRREYVSLLMDEKQYAAAEAQVGAYARAFPEDAVFPVQARADLALKQGSDDAALRVYDKAFQPLWPEELLNRYLELLDKNSDLRDFLARARVAREKNRGDIEVTGRLFAYYRHGNNLAAARRALLEYRMAKEAKPGSWTAGELLTLAGLWERVPDANEQARSYYALYSAPGATASDQETALAGMIGLLLDKPDQPIRFGSGDLSLYKDIGTADSSPGFLNGILSLVLNFTGVRYQYAEQNAAAGAYFHRAEGARLLELLESRFPASTHRAALRSSLIDAYASYGDDDGVIAGGRAFLTSFRTAPQRTHVALALADALARQKRTQEEFAVYQQMLAELAAKAGGVPLGVHGGGAPEPARGTGRFSISASFPGQHTERPQAGARSPDYAEVLNKYLARLAAVGQPMEALRVYRRELDRNPNDPGLYERFAGFLEQSNLGADVQDVYRRAIAKFPDKSWYHKLARWYLRGRQQNALAAITREATGIFSGTELESYFGDVVQTGNVGPALYLQLNLYAHQRFPEDLVFVHNLLNAYGTRATSDATSATALLHEYWFYDADLKRRYFEQLSQSGQLLNQIAAVQKTQAGNSAAVELNAEAEAWLSHFEAAAAGLRATAEAYPGSVEKDETAASLYRSLAAYFPGDTQVAAGFEQKAYEAEPRDPKLLETVGDIYADREEFARAATPWNAILQVFPGKPDGYLETATVYWDYYRFDDALRVIRDARTKYRDQALFAYEAGAIEEGRRDYRRAVEEYLAGSGAGNQQARARIVRLASRPAQRDLIYQMTANSDAELRIDVLEAQQRKPELEAFLGREIAVATQVAAIAPLVTKAREEGFEDLEREGLEREAAVTQDPVERMRLRIDLAKYYESKKDIDAAARTLDALYRDNSLILGVVRARVDFDKRNKRNDDSIAALTDAAEKSRPDLSADFRFEAAHVATDAGHIDQARGFLTELLKKDPWRADYLAQMAETYAAANDDAGFIQYARMEIEALKKAPVPAEDRKQRIAALRRRLVVTLTRRNDFAGAMDQYIEVVNAYPEDRDVAREAGLFAAAHRRQDQLTSFYQKTIAAAPKDWRWPIVLARVETALEDYPAALRAYDTAMKVRADRADLVEARLLLEERLLRFEDAITSCQRLYQLTYSDSDWLDKAAEFQARLGRGSDAVTTLERAHIGAGGETVSGLFAIADELDQWHLTSDAARFAERGYALAGKDMALKYPNLLVTYASIMAGARRDDAILAIDRKDVNALRAAGTRIAEVYTPEEKAALAARPGVGQALAQAAGLEDNLAQMLFRTPAPPQWIALQSRRGLYERVADVAPFGQAARAAENSGDVALELRVYARMQAAGQMGGVWLDRYLNLLLQTNPPALVAQRSDRAVQVAIAAGNEAVTRDALRARATSLPPVWLSAYTALTGVYFDDRRQDVNQAFLAALNPQTIGQRLAAKPDANRSLVGSIWFYYGARYGEYLAHGAHGSETNAANYLASEPELQPGNPDVYTALGDFDLETKRLPEAIAEFRKAVDLDAHLGETHDGIARALMQQGHRAEAVAEWRDAMAAFQYEQSQGVRVRDTFWTHVSSAVGAIADAKAFTDLQPDIHRLLADYVHRNGQYRLDELIDPVLDAAYRSNAGFDWLLDLGAEPGWTWSNRIPNPDEEEWLERYRTGLGGRKGFANMNVQLIELLLKHGKTAEALAEWRALPQSERINSTLETRIAGAEGTVDQLIVRYRADPAKAPPFLELTFDATALREDGHVPAALALLEFAYTRELDQQRLTIANFLGLARVYLERGNSLNQALATLRRMTLVGQTPETDQPFLAYEPAGDLLVEFHHDAEAREFYTKAVQATPWNAQAKLKLGNTAAVISDTTAPYELRAEAAIQAAPTQAAATRELALLTSGNKSADAARKPFYVESRLAAASAASDPAVKLNLLRQALAIAPDNERVRNAAIMAAINAHNDRLALAMSEVTARPMPVETDQPQPEDGRFNGFHPVFARDTALLKALSGAAERTGDLPRAERLLQEAGGDTTALKAEQKRREENTKRQPVVTDKLEQPRIVRMRELQ